MGLDTLVYPRVNNHEMLPRICHIFISYDRLVRSWNTTPAPRSFPASVLMVGGGSHDDNTCCFRLVTMQYFVSSTDDLYLVDRVRSSFCNISCVILRDTWAGLRNGRLGAGASLCSCRSSERLSTETFLKLILTQSMQMCKSTQKY